MNKLYFNDDDVNEFRVFSQKFGKFVRETESFDGYYNQMHKLHLKKYHSSVDGLHLADFVEVHRSFTLKSEQAVEHIGQRLKDLLAKYGNRELDNLARNVKPE